MALRPETSAYSRMRPQPTPRRIARFHRSALPRQIHRISPHNEAGEGQHLCRRGGPDSPRMRARCEHSCLSYRIAMRGTCRSCAWAHQTGNLARMSLRDGFRSCFPGADTHSGRPGSGYPHPLQPLLARVRPSWSEKSRDQQVLTHDRRASIPYGRSS